MNDNVKEIISVNPDSSLIPGCWKLLCITKDHNESFIQMTEIKYTTKIKDLPFLIEGSIVIEALRIR